MKLRKTIFIGLALLMLVLTLVSCGSEKSLPEDTAISEETTKGQNKLEAITMEMLDQYIIVRPDQVGDNLMQAAESLYSSIKTATNSKVNIKTDFYVEHLAYYKIGDYEILVGETNRPESSQFISGMRANDYGFTIIGNKIVIAGGSEEATISAIQLFKSTVLDKLTTESTTFYSAEQNTLKNGHYDINQLLIGKVPVQKFRIVYTTNPSGSEKIIAENLAVSICQSTGYMLDVVTDSTERGDVVHEILIGNTNRNKQPTMTITSQQGYMGFDGNDILFYGSSSAIISEAVRCFVSQFADKSKESIILKLSKGEAVSFKYTTLNGKSIAFISNSQLYYGNLVNQKPIACCSSTTTWSKDNGYFNRLCQLEGQDVSVYNFTHGGLTIQSCLNCIKNNTDKKTDKSIFEDMDYVVLSQAGTDTLNNLCSTVFPAVRELFPNAQLYYINNYHYSTNSQLKEEIKKFSANGVILLDWGNMARDIVNTGVGTSTTYNASTFIIDNNSHPNNLSAYLMTLMTYCAITGESAARIDTKFTNETNYIPYFTISAIKAKYTSLGKTSNFVDILNSPAELLALRKSIDARNKLNGCGPRKN